MNARRLRRELMGLSLAMLLISGCGSGPQDAEVTVTLSPTHEPAPTPASDFIRLEADGSGDYATLEEAVQHVSEGGTISLGPGTYYIQGPLDIERSLSLVGEGMEETEIVCEGEGPAGIRFASEGSLAGQDITFRYAGGEAAGVVFVEEGEATFTHCRFTGGVIGEFQVGGNGLSLGPGVTAVVQDCEAIGNERWGIFAGALDVTLERNLLRDSAATRGRDLATAVHDAGEVRPRQGDCPCSCCSASLAPRLRGVRDPHLSAAEAYWHSSPSGCVSSRAPSSQTRLASSTVFRLTSS